MRYTWGESHGTFRTKGVDPQKVGEHLEGLRAEVGDALTTQVVVENARSPSAPTHPCFEWDDSQAAMDWRTHQARNMLNTLQVVITSGDGTTRSFVANVHVVTPDKQNAYVPTLVAVGDTEYKRQVIAEAQRYLDGFRRRYKDLEEFAPVVAAIEAVAAALKQPDAA